MGVKAGIVNLPPAFARHGIMGWSSLAHETGGHDILHADTGLIDQLGDHVYSRLTDSGLGDGLLRYWADRVDETASDVLGVLNIGPAAGIGLIALFRGYNAAFTGVPKLRNVGPRSDPHPADIVRGFLAAAAANLLSFSGSGDWAKCIESEADKDVETIFLADTKVSPEKAQKISPDCGVSHSQR